MMDEINYQPLAVLADVIDPHPSHRAPKSQTQGIPFLGIGDFESDSSINLSKVRIVAENVYEEHKARYSLDDDLLAIGRVASIGKVIRLPKKESPYVISPTLAVLKPKDINISYLRYALQAPTFISQLEEMSTGSTRKSVGIQNLRKAKIPLFSCEEQKRIVAILDQVFAEIDKARANTKVNLYKSTQLFDNYLKAIFQNTIGDWQYTELGTLCEKMEYGSSAKSFVEGDIPVLRMGNIQNRKLDWSDLKYSVDKQEIEKYKLKFGDVLFNRTNSAEHVGKSAIYKSEEPAIFAGYLIRIHRKEKLLDGDFLNYYLNSSIARDYGKTVMSQSVNQANINAAKLKEYPIRIPNLETQKKLVITLRELDSKTGELENNYQRKIIALDVLKKSILQKAFTGELHNAKSKGVAA